MKTTPKIAILLIVLAIFKFNALICNDQDLTGTWSGTFMEQFKIQFEFSTQDDGDFSGRIKLYDGSNQIQDDQLSQILIEGETLSFFITAKNTSFSGNIDVQAGIINGKFTFPDGSLHSVTVLKEFESNNAVKAEVPNVELPAEWLVNDLYLAYGNILEFHPNPYTSVEKDQFALLEKQLSEDIGQQESIIEFYKKISKLTDAVGCSHTGARLPNLVQEDLRQKGNYFPLKIWFNDGKAYYVSGLISSKEIIPGKEIISINGNPVDNLISKIFNLIPSEGDNLTTKYNEINRHFYDYLVLFENTESFEVNYRITKSNAIQLVSVESCDYKDAQFVYADNMNKSVIEGFPVSFEITKNKNIGILTIPSFAIRDINYYISYMDSIFKYMDEYQIDDLIIDLRNNNGGHPIFAAQLFSYLANEPFVYFESTDKLTDFEPLYHEMPPNSIHFDGNCVVLVNGGCLSTTGHFISLLRNYQLATFIGEEPGSTFTCNDMSKQFTLPNSGIEMNIPTTVFTTAVDDTKFMEKEIVDVPVAFDVSDLISNEDKYLEVALEQF